MLFDSLLPIISRTAQDSSVDQLVRQRPGCLLRSSDPDAELRYLVEVCVQDVQLSSEYDLTRRLRFAER